MNWHVTGKRGYIPEYSSMLADENKTGQPDLEGEITV
jgi:hypothetical protein